MNYAVDVLSSYMITLYEEQINDARIFILVFFTYLTLTLL